MDAEIQYANTERKLLAIVFACQSFSTYLLGRSFTAENDHKLLEMIAIKNLASVPPHLQSSVPIHSARLAASTKTCATYSKEILGLQR